MVRSVSNDEYMIANSILDIDKQCQAQDVHIDQLEYPVSIEGTNPGTVSIDPVAQTVELQMAVNYAVSNKATDGCCGSCNKDDKNCNPGAEQPIAFIQAKP